MMRRSQELHRPQSSGDRPPTPQTDVVRSLAEQSRGQQPSRDRSPTPRTEATRRSQELHRPQSSGDRPPTPQIDVVRSLAEQSRRPQSSGGGASTSRTEVTRPEEFEMTPTTRRGVQRGEGSDHISSAPDDRRQSRDGRFEAAATIEEGRASADRSPSLDAQVREDAQKLLQALKINPHNNESMEDAIEVHKALQAISSAEKRITEMQKKLVSASPAPKTVMERIAAFNITPKASVEWQITRWKAQIKGPRDTSTRMGYFADKFDKMNQPLERLLQKSGRVGTLGLSTLQATISSSFPSSIAKKFVWATIVTSLGPSLVGNKLFKDAPYPLGAVLNTAQWEVSNVGGYFFQEAVQPSHKSTASQVGNATTSHVGNATTSGLSEFMSKRLDNFKRELTADEIVDVVRNSVDDFLTQRGYPIKFD